MGKEEKQRYRADRRTTGKGYQAKRRLLVVFFIIVLPAKSAAANSCKTLDSLDSSLRLGSLSTGLVLLLRLGGSDLISLGLLLVGLDDQPCHVQEGV